MKNFYPFIYRSLSGFLAFLLLQAPVRAQLAGSREVIHGYMAVAAGCTQASASESLYIGPGTYLINGTWQIYSKNVWISPDAIMTGSGTIKFFDPSVAGGTSSATLADGNNTAHFINVNMVLDNSSDLTLTDLALPADLSSAGWIDSSSNADFNIRKDFDFVAANGNALLGDYDMTLTTTATLSGYQESRFAVTAGTGHLVKQDFSGAFIFPVGMAAGDYTPAQVTNTVANTIHVNVTDYAGVTAATFANAITAPQEGIDRGWNIYADNAAGNSAIDLQHNSATEGTAYSDNASFVTRLGATIPNYAGDNTSYSYWESNISGAGSGSGTLTTGAAVGTASERNRAYTTLATGAADYTAWYTKSSDILTPLPFTLKSFTGRVSDCGTVKLEWTTVEEQSVRAYSIEQSNDGVHFSEIGSVAAYNGAGANAYDYLAAQAGGLKYYRLKIAETSGAYRYSNITAVTMDCTGAATRMYPVPFTGQLTIVVPAGNVRAVQVTDILGRTVKAATTINGSLLQVDGSALTAGTYVLRLLKNDGTVETLKAIKK